MPPNDDLRMAELDQRQFRDALGSFATGVTIVTTSVNQGEPIGVTASSFNSVSLDPPLVLWSLGKSSKSFKSFRDSGHFAVHVLACHQQALSNCFAKSGADKFADVEWDIGVIGSPVFPDFAAKFECRTVHQYEGGDHIIFVGEVIKFEQNDVAPLVFHAGRYAETRPGAKGAYSPGVEPSEARFTDDFVLYLVALAHFQSNASARRRLAVLQITQTQYFALTTLALGAGATQSQLHRRLEHTGAPPVSEDLKFLLDRSYASLSGDTYLVTAAGRALVMEMLSFSKSTEEALLANFTPGEIADFKYLLKKFISLTGESDPKLWGE